MNSFVSAVLTLVITGYWNHLTVKRFDFYRLRANERLLRLERAAEKNGWKLPRCSFGFFTDEDLYPDSDLTD